MPLQILRSGFILYILMQSRGLPTTFTCFETLVSHHDKSKLQLLDKNDGKWKKNKRKERQESKKREKKKNIKNKEEQRKHTRKGNV